MKINLEEEDERELEDAPFSFSEERLEIHEGKFSREDPSKSITTRSSSLLVFPEEEEEAEETNRIEEEEREERR